MFVADHPVDLAVVHGLAFDAAPVAVLVVDRDGRILLANRELERQFGYSRDELIGASVDLLIPGAAPNSSGLLSEPPQPAETETHPCRPAMRGLGRTVPSSRSRSR